MAYVVEELVVERMVVLGEWPIVVEVRRSYCVLLFYRERNVNGGEKERYRVEKRE